MDMNAQVCLCLVAALMSLLRSCGSDLSSGSGPQYVAVGGSIKLSLAVHETITQLAWYFHRDLVGDYIGGEITYYGRFNGRTTLNISSGQVEIRDAVLDDSGTYSVELNSKRQSGEYTVKVLRKVPRPQVRSRTLTCTEKSKNCTLSCEGDIAQAEPVSYSWNRGMGWEQKNMNIDLINDEKTRAVPEIFCRMRNPVSEDTSGPFDNPFYPRSPVGAVVGGVIGCVTLAIAAAVAYVKRDALRTCFTRNRGVSRDEEPIPEYNKAPTAET